MFSGSMIQVDELIFIHHSSYTEQDLVANSIASSFSGVILM